MTDFKARARGLAENICESASLVEGFEWDSAIESALLQFGREVLQAEPTREMTYAVHELASKGNVSIADTYRAMAAVRAKELE